MRFGKAFIIAGASSLGLTAGAASAQQVFASDLIVQGSACIGGDCTTSESFGFDTLRLKENNLRIKAQDTSASGSFPATDWELTFNDSDNGGINRFSVADVTANTRPFTVEGGAPTNALYADDAGNIGMGTGSPVLQAHIVFGNSPGLRLEQDGSSGFATQTWDIAGNETNFFVRDVTNGSQLPFKIKPGADDNALFVAADNDIGLLTANPSAPLHLRRTGTIEASILVESAGTANSTIKLRQAGDAPITWAFTNNHASGRLNVGIDGGNTPLKIEDSANNNLVKIGDNSNPDALIVAGRILVNAQQLNVPDYVFEDDYDLMPLDQVSAFIQENGHLPRVPSAYDINSGDGLSLVDMQMKLLEKVEELTLYTLAQEETMRSQQDVIAGLQARIDAMQTNP